ncbi:hypothetical protein ARSEF4850_006884 [Beauveria asiatica]
MAVEMGGTSEASSKRKATAEYFYLEIEGHYECYALLTKPLGKCHSKCRLSSVSCCPGRVSHAAVRHKAVLHINDKIEPGYWSWTDHVREGPCEEKRDALMAKIEPRHSNLKEKFDAAKARQNPKLRTQSFQRILEDIELADENNRSSNLTLEQDVMFTCHAETFERKIRDGIAILRSASTEDHRTLFSRLVDYRANPTKSLCEIFDEDVAHTTSKNAKAQWLPGFSASMATVVARAYDAQHSESDKLIPAHQETKGPGPGPVIGVNALIICSALNEQPYLFSEVCDKLGLKNLATLPLDVTTQLDDAERRWRIATQNWERMARTEIEAARTRLNEDVQILLRELRHLCRDWSNAMTAEVSLSEHSVPNHDSSSQNVECAEEAGSVASDEGSLFMPFQPSVDSGYVSNAGSEQMYGSTLAAPSSGAFIFPSALSSRRNVQRDPAAAAGETEGGGEWTGAAAGQKRTQAGVSVTSKRHRPSAAETTASSNTGEGSNADPASTSHTAPRDDTTSGTLGDTADPHIQALLDPLPQLEFSSEYLDAVLDGISATSGMVYNGGDGMEDGIPATYGMAHMDMPISDEFQDVVFSEIAATLPSFLSEPQPNGTVPPAEEHETQPPAIQDKS